MYGQSIKNNSKTENTTMKIKHLYALLLATLLFSCDDSTDGIGNSTIAQGDSIPAGVANYAVSTHSILADSVYARTSTAYLGRYTDPKFGEFTADFIAQFNCGDNFQFPETIQEITGLELRLYYTSHFGDSLNAMKLQVDTLSRVIPEKSMGTFYTSLDLEQYYNPDARPLASKSYSARGISAGDSTYTVSDSYGNTSKYTSYWQDIKLPKSLAQKMYDKYLENKDYYKDSESFINNVLKGIYMQCTHGDGTILYIDDIRLFLNFDYMVKSSSGRVDSIAEGTSMFTASKEVIQANRFKNSDALKELIEDNSCTYLKTPAGLFTEVELPIEEIAEAHKRDTLNAVSLTFTRYNEKEDSKYPMGIPEYLLMVRKSDLYTFFEKNEIHDNESSFVTQFVKTGENGNTYTFNNIASLIALCMSEKENNRAGEDWNKVVLVPVKVETDRQGNIIGLKSNLDMESAMLKGGKNTPIQMRVLYTTF